MGTVSGRIRVRVWVRVRVRFRVRVAIDCGCLVGLYVLFIHSKGPRTGDKGDNWFWGSLPQVYIWEPKL